MKKRLPSAWLERLDLTGRVKTVSATSPVSRRYNLEALEPRYLMSADAGGLLIHPGLAGTDKLIQPAVIDTPLLSNPDTTLNLSGSSTVAAATFRHEVVIVDMSVQDHEQLIEDLLNKAGENRQLDIYVIDTKQDGIAQISEILSGYRNLDAVHIISHSSDAELQLGDTLLTNATLGEYADQIAGWSKSLGAQADLLFYGCDLAARPDGVMLVNALCSLTGADVAASTDATGNAVLGGNWTLEYATGSIETASALSAQAQQDWMGLLASQTVSDQFSVAQYNNNDGTANWASDWLESGEADGAGAGSIHVDGSNQNLVFNGAIANASLSRAVNLGGATAATLSFDWSVSSSAATAGSVALSVYDGTSWTPLQNFDLTTASGVATATINISAYASAATQIRFQVTNAADDPNAALVVDNVKIDYITYSAPTLNTTSDTYTEDTPQTLSPIVINGPDSPVVTATLTLSDALAGDLNADSYGTAAASFSNGQWSATGTIGDVNTLLAGLSFTPSLNYNGTITINISVNDGTSTVTAAKTLTGIPVNDAPAPQIPGPQQTTVGTPVTFSAAQGNAIVIDDVDAGNGMLTVTLSASYGKVSLTPGTTAVSGNNTSTLTLSGTLPQLNAALDTLVFTPQTGFKGVATLIVTTNDNGNTGNGTAQVSTDTVIINVDTAPQTLWLSTVSKSNDGGSGLSSWNAGTVLSVGDPNLNLGDATSGTLSPVFNINVFAGGGYADVNALHYVTHDTTLGSLLTTTVHAGDVIFTVNKNMTLNGTRSVNENDVVLFHPTTLGDYSAGSFSILMSNPTGNKISALTLVEQDVTVNGTLLTKGTILYSDNGSKDIKEMVLTSLLNGFSLSSRSTFITGSSVGINQNIGDIDLIESTRTVGNNTLQAGTLLISLEGDGTVGISSAAADSTLAVTRNDIFALNIVSGATHLSMFMDGSDIGLSSDAEAVTSFSLVGSNTPPRINNTVNGQTVDDNSTIKPFGSALILDDDSPAQDLTVTVALDDANKGAFTTLNGFTSLGNGQYTFTGTAAAATTALQGLVFTPTPNRVAPGSTETTTFTLSVDDHVALAVTDNTTTVVSKSINDAPTTSAVTLTAIGEDGGPRVITQAELLTNANDVDGPSLTAINLAISTGNGTLTDNNDGTWTYTPALNDDTSVSFAYTVTDGSLTAAGTATLDITPVNDAPTTSAVTLTAIGEDGGPRVITQTELLANANDVDGPSLTAINLAISTGNGTLTDNNDGTWTYTPALNDDTSVSFAYTVTDGSLTAAGTATLDITPVNDAPTTSAVTLTAIGEDSGPRVITQMELLANANDVDGPSLTAINLAISTGNGTLTDNNDGTWTYTPALNDDSSVSFAYTVTDGSLTAAGTATLDITPVNDPPTTSAVTLTAIGEDSGPRVITQTDLLANANDVDGPSLTAINLAISTGNGTLTDNNDGTWTYTPALNDDTSVSFAYTVTDGSLTAAGTATLDITPVNDPPTISGSDSGQPVDDNKSIAPFKHVTIDDVDIPAQDLTVTVSLDDSNKGTFTTLNGFSDDGGGQYSFNGTAAAATQAIRGLVFTPTANHVAPGSTETTTFTLSVDDHSAAAVMNSDTTVVSTSINDAPVLLADNFTINDNVPIGTPACSLQSSDPDTGETLRYAIAGGSAAAAFGIDPVTGVIRVADGSVLRANNTPSMTLVVSVSDAYGLTTTIELTVTVNPLSKITNSGTPPVPSPTPIGIETTDKPPMDSPTSDNGNDQTTDTGRQLAGNHGVVGSGQVKAATGQPAPVMVVEAPAMKVVPVNTDGGLSNVQAPISFRSAGAGALSALIHNASFTRELDQIRNEAQHDITLAKITAGASIATTTGLSVGYVAWLVRGGALLSSVLSSLPAWRMIDPLPILAFNRREEDEEDDESLESMVRKGNLKDAQTDEA